MPTTLTEAQTKCFNAIKRLALRLNRPPSVRELAKELKYASTNAVSDMLIALEKKSYIKRHKGARGLEVIYKDALSEIGLGGMSERTRAVEIMSVDWQAKQEKLRPERALHLDKFLMGDADCFLAVIEDDGMEKSGILKRDLALVEKRQPLASEKGIKVGVIYSEGFIVREFDFVNGQIHLRASNRGYNDKVIKPNEKLPEAIVVGVVRSVLRVKV
jgi:SOS-response transcriptional repressor LexA